MTHAIHPEAKRLIRELALVPHPEGGYFRETYRSPLEVLSEKHSGARSAYTTIYFLLAGHQYSAWHQVASDESWFFHVGSDIEIYSLLPQSGELVVQTIGAVCGRFECTIAAGHWFAAKPKDPNAYSLVSCAVAPGFVFEDFVLATREDLQALISPTHSLWPLASSLLVKPS
jgi:predicted cupin superfamily sugar epimerase